MNQLLKETARRAIRYLEDLSSRKIAPTEKALANLEQFDIDLPEVGWDDEKIVEFIDDVGSPATMASAGGRYFGFVVGGSLPAALAANWLAGAWDQMSGLYTSSPVMARLEEISASWLLEVLDLNPEMAVGFTSGATMANFSGLAAARTAILARQGWDVEDQGLFGAPEIKVIVGAEYHASMRKALSLIGLGRERVTKVPVDDQGRIIASQVPALDDRTIVCLQAGNVNTGSFDPMEEIISRAQQKDAWVHVDGAFGLWARASAKYKSLTAGIEWADSIATDAHKWLNVPYDSGLLFVREARALNRAMASSAAYLIESGKRENFYYVPEMSRRGRGVEIYSALLSLGSKGLADLIERCCRLAELFAELLRNEGYQILNDVVLNQVLVSFGTPSKTRAVIEGIQHEGTFWAGGTEWQGNTAMRISVSSWVTTEEDVHKSVATIKKVVSSIKD